MKRVSGESLKALAKAAMSPLFQAFSWAMRTLMMLSSWRVAVWSGFGSCEERSAGANSAKLRVASRSEKRSVMSVLWEELVLFEVTVERYFVGRASDPDGLIVAD